MPDIKFSNKYPYTDFHELNLDWVIKEVKYWSTKVGKTIQSIELTGTAGLVDTYTITYSDGTISTFDVTNGNGITSVAKTGTAGLVDTYTITFQDGSTSTFDVTNGTASIDKTLSLSDYAADAKVTGDSVGALSEKIDITITSVGGVNEIIDTPITKNRIYRYINNTTGNVNLAIKKRDGTFSVVSSNLAAGKTLTFVASVPGIAIRTYFAVAGNTKFESIDDGIFSSIADISDMQNTVMNQMTINITSPGGTNIIADCLIFKDRIYKYTNNTSGSANLYIRDLSGSFILVSSNIAAGDELEFKASTDGDAIRTYTANAGTCVFTSGDQNIYNYVQNVIQQADPADDYTSVAMFESIAVIGDSYASGGIYISSPDNWGMNYDLSWPAILQRLIGSMVNNYSKAGLSTRTWLTDATRGLTKALNDNPSGLYLMCLGINDSGIPGYLGSISDIHDDDYTLNADTFYGNYGRIMAQLITHAPNGKFVFIVPPNALGAGYGTAIVNIAAHYSVPVLLPSGDAYFSSDFWADNMENAHPVAMTYAGMAQAYIRQMSKCIQNNETYFYDYHQAT